MLVSLSTVGAGAEEPSGAEPVGLHWADLRAHFKGCDLVGTLSLYDVRCEDSQGNRSTQCADLSDGALFRGHPLFGQQRLSDRAWTSVATFGQKCSASWNHAGAQWKSSKDGVAVLHVRCESDRNGLRSTNCGDMRRGPFLGREMTTEPQRLSDRSWTEVTVKVVPSSTAGASAGESSLTDPAGLTWADLRAHFQGCSPETNFSLYHVRCEDSQGNGSKECADLSPDSFVRGARQQVAPRRLEDRTWTAVSIVDQNCVLRWNDDEAHWKSLKDGVAVLDVRCEDRYGNASTKCPDMPRRLFLGREMTADPKRLSDRSWTEVQVKN